MIKNFLLVLASILFAVLLIEAVLRFAFTPPPLETRMALVAAGVTGDDSTLQWEPGRMAYAPLQTGTITHAEYEHTVAVDRYGFRNPCLQEPIEGILTGDSSVFGIGLDDQSTFQCVNARLGNSTYTMGVSGASPRHLINFIDEHVKRLQAEFSFKDKFFVQYILSVGGDFPRMISFKNPESRQAEKRDNSKQDEQSTQERINKFVYHDSLLRYSYVLQMLKLVAISTAPQCKDCNYIDLRGGDRLYKKNIDQSEAERHADGVVRYFDAAAEAARNAGANDVQFVLLRGAYAISKLRLDKELGLVGIPAAEVNLDYQRDIIARAAMRRPDITVIDPTSCLQQYTQLTALHYEFDGHFTAIGAETFLSCISTAQIIATGR